jgi:hypothetical protein
MKARCYSDVIQIIKNRFMKNKRRTAFTISASARGVRNLLTVRLLRWQPAVVARNLGSAAVAPSESTAVFRRRKGVVNDEQTRAGSWLLGRFPKVCRAGGVRVKWKRVDSFGVSDFEVQADSRHVPYLSIKKWALGVSSGQNGSKMETMK